MNERDVIRLFWMDALLMVNGTGDPHRLLAFFEGRVWSFVGVLGT